MFTRCKTKMRKINLNEVCRACLSERGNLREIFSTKIPRMMEFCANIDISESDQLPHYVCVSCFHLIARLYTFKKKMERSDRILRAYLKQNRLIHKDILNIAISEAQIKEQEDLIEEEIPLSKRTSNKSRLTRKSKEKANQIINNVLKDESVNTKEQILYTQEIYNSPPPLVPLETDKRLENVDNIVIPNLMVEEPPPLVPLSTSTVTENPIDIDLKCATCNQQFETISSLKEHKNICQENTLKCNICRKEFKDPKRLIGHLKGHMVAKAYGCKICGKRYPNPSTFRVHMRTHTGERPFKCQICNKGFVRWAGVLAHMRTHQSHKPYKCDTCGKSFKIASNLERHKVLHADSLPFCCNYCGKTFSQADNLQLHIRTYHTHERPYLCNECGKGFVSSTRLNRHMWVHSGYKPYRCKSCTKAYSNSNDLKNHERSHLGGNANDKPYGCRICDMRFYHLCRLSKHMKTHERPYSCSICCKGFSSATLLNKHLTGKNSVHYVPVEDVQRGTEENQIFLEY